MSIDLVIALYRCLVHSLSKNVDTLSLYFGLAGLVNLTDKKNPSLMLFFCVCPFCRAILQCSCRQLWQLLSFAQLGKWEWLAVDGEWAVGARDWLATTWHYFIEETERSLALMTALWLVIILEEFWHSDWLGCERSDWSYWSFRWLVVYPSSQQP